MRVDLFDFELPPELIAQRPAEPRESARLLELAGGPAEHRVADLPDLLRPDDHLILNDTRVLPTRFFARRGNATVEVTLVERIDARSWWCLAKPGKRLRQGDAVGLAEGLAAEVAEKREDGFVRLVFALEGLDLLAAIRRHGSMPLPPYIKRPRGGDARDLADYQTVFGRHEGSVAAPTASLHLTGPLMERLRERGIGWSFVTLHVGLGTFLPVKAEDTEAHRMHSEWWEVPEATAQRVNAARAGGGRLVAVGTTVLRTLETATDEAGVLQAGQGSTDIFITPGHRFRSAELLLTNFHLPRSTLFMLVSAFAGLERMRGAYAFAIDRGYRFFSYGDACLLHRRPDPS
ncbi:tRNA preQ1(34) S-adenosylmethionine ribosyltransferase-isomerase QueA [Marinimicrococcus flavescens]|uniref:S-adenosylmethionine:tRNA ribosyltransferase-isomerase n=1 Tax=Marinimicrococcus flavescens TaxID=3031815 RepID=A0AAP3XQI5_9PROT|nr:tRNA preQ1(34) S-adenosylmethionine ribosyltransferase-isomerase QueA [Marinimicrococcus flavescens]